MNSAQIKSDWVNNPAIWNSYNRQIAASFLNGKTTEAISKTHGFTEKHARLIVTSVAKAALEHVGTPWTHGNMTIRDILNIKDTLLKVISVPAKTEVSPIITVSSMNVPELKLDSKMATQLSEHGVDILMALSYFGDNVKKVNRTSLANLANLYSKFLISPADAEELLELFVKYRVAEKLESTNGLPFYYFSEGVNGPVELLLKEIQEIQDSFVKNVNVQTELLPVASTQVLPELEPVRASTQVLNETVNVDKYANLRKLVSLVSIDAYDGNRPQKLKELFVAQPKYIDILQAMFQFTALTGSKAYIKDIENAVKDLHIGTDDITSLLYSLGDLHIGTYINATANEAAFFRWCKRGGFNNPYNAKATVKVMLG